MSGVPPLCSKQAEREEKRKREEDSEVRVNSSVSGRELRRYVVSRPIHPFFRSPHMTMNPLPDGKRLPARMSRGAIRFSP